MIPEFVSAFMERKGELETLWREKQPDSYDDIVREVVEILPDGELYSDEPDPERIHKIDDGDYQGTLVYVIGAKGYQPWTYWYVKVGYGSCSGCDTLESIKTYSDAPATDGQIKDYMTLALHVVQGIKKMGDED